MKTSTGKRGVEKGITLFQKVLPRYQLLGERKEVESIGPKAQKKGR